MVARNEPHAAHIGGKCIHLVHAASSDESVVTSPKVEEFELVSVDVGVLRGREIHATNPVAAFLQVRHKVVPDEPPRSGHEYTLHDIPLSIVPAAVCPSDRRSLPALLQ